MTGRRLPPRAAALLGRGRPRAAAVTPRELGGLLELGADAVLLIDSRQQLVLLNGRAEQCFGYRGAQALGLAAHTVLGLDGAGAGQLRAAARGARDGQLEAACRDRHGRSFPAEVVLSPLRLGRRKLQLLQVRDVSARQHFQAVLLDQASHDALTGLPNRQLLSETLRGAIGAARRQGHGLAVLLIDLDHFKRINDSFGMAFGDALLRAVVARLQHCLAGAATLARQGGDVFIALQPRLADAGAAGALAESLLAALRLPFQLDGRHLFLSASIGIGLLPDGAAGAEESSGAAGAEGSSGAAGAARSSGAAGAEELLGAAELAMHSAKQQQRDGYRFHTAAMALALRERVELEAELRQALARQQLLLHYQPRLSLSSGAMVGMEALLRWQHPQRGMVAPASFIGLAEETGLIEEIGLWVLRTACRQARAWQEQGLAPLTVSVNLSARQFQQPGLAAGIAAILADSALAPAWLELEITEGTVMRDSDSAIGTLRSLKQLGVTLSIDDFGTGYSSLSYLKLFPIDVLKIDRAFITDVCSDADDAAITRTIVLLGHSLGLRVVAEGVETQPQLDFLRACGCDGIQGYYFSRPLTAEAMAGLLREPRRLVMGGPAGKDATVAGDIAPPC